MKDILVIHEHDFDDGEDSVIGVADSVENAEKLMKEYYREWKEVSFRDIRDSGLEYEKVIRLWYSPKKKSTYDVKITLQWFTINEA